MSKDNIFHKKVRKVLHLSAPVDKHLATDLHISSENYGHLYRRKTAIIAYLKKKASKGVYDSAKAAKLWLHYVTEAAKQYKQDLGIHVGLSTRKEVAKRLEKDHRP